MRSIIFILSTLILFSCDFTPDEKVVPAWDTEIFGPLAKSKLLIEDIIQLQDIHGSYKLKFSDIPGFSAFTTSQNIAIPPFGPVNVPSSNIDLSNSFGNVDLDSGQFYFVITNNLQVGVNSGAKLLIEQNNTTLTNTPLPAINKNGGTYTLNPKIDLAGKSLFSTLKITLQNLSSSGSGGVIAFDPNRELIVDLYVNNLKIKSVTLTSANSFTLSDTTDFSLTANAISTESVSGTFTTYITNGMPVGYKVQAYFLDQNYNTIDSLFNPKGSINASPTTGSPAQSNGTTESALVTPINETKMNNLETAKYISFIATVSNAANVKLTTKDTLGMQLVADLKLRVSPK